MIRIVQKERNITEYTLCACIYMKFQIWQIQTICAFLYS